MTDSKDIGERTIGVKILNSMCGTFCMPSLIVTEGTEISKGGNFDQDALSYVGDSPPASSGDITVISQILHL